MYSNTCQRIRAQTSRTVYTLFYSSFRQFCNQFRFCTHSFLPLTIHDPRAYDRRPTRSSCKTLLNSQTNYSNHRSLPRKQTVFLTVLDRFCCTAGATNSRFQRASDFSFLNYVWGKVQCVNFVCLSLFEYRRSRC